MKKLIAGRATSDVAFAIVFRKEALRKKAEEAIVELRATLSHFN
jgi:hypothetical protein